MLISCAEITSVWGIKPDGVLHIGAHEAEEYHQYIKHSWNPVIWIEAQRSLAEKLKSALNPDQNKVIHAAVWDSDDVELDLKITNNSQSTSLLDLGTHNDDYPEITVTKIEKIRTSRVDSILDNSVKIEFVNLDIQGAEMQALKGMGSLLNQVNYIYTEVNNKKVYIDCAQIEEIEKFLNQKGFEKVCVRWIPGKGWGDAFFIRSGKIRKSTITNIKLLYYKCRFYSFFLYREYAHQIKVILMNRISR